MKLCVLMSQRSLLFSLSLATLLSVSLSSGSAIAQTITGTVVSVGDGDTIRVKTTDKTLTVRLACVDAPEVAQAPYGQAASTRLKQLLPLGQTVSLRIADTDRYGRSVAKVYQGNQSINLALVQEGRAVVYRQYLKSCPELRDRLLSAEAQAKQRRLGLWAQANPVMPWEFRRSGTTKASPSRPQASVQQKPMRTLRAPTSPSSSLPSCVNSDCSCSDFRSQAEAQRVLEAFPSDRFRLDQDRDGIACESLR
jgi:micrococcal nuclease